MAIPQVGQDDQQPRAAPSARLDAAEVKEHKQAEFLVYERFPFDLVERIGVQSLRTKTRAADALAGTGHQPAIEVHADWYF